MDRSRLSKGSGRTLRSCRCEHRRRGLFLRNAGMTYSIPIGADVDDNRIMQDGACSSSRSTRGRTISIAWSRCSLVGNDG